MPSTHKHWRAGVVTVLPEMPTRPAGAGGWRETKAAEAEPEAERSSGPATARLTRLHLVSTHTYMCMCRRNEPCSIDAHAQIPQVGASQRNHTHFPTQGRGRCRVDPLPFGRQGTSRQATGATTQGYPAPAHVPRTPRPQPRGSFTRETGAAARASPRYPLG